MSLLGEVVEELSGMPYEEYIRKEILDPLGMQDTRTFLPEDQYGTSLAIGYSALGREGNRHKVNFFKARGVTSAAGFSSNVTDLAKFASWQFRLMDTTSIEILKPSTLKQMHNVHWIDQDGKNMWGLGFGIAKTPDGDRMVGHSGGCPGYNTLFSMVPDKNRAYAVFTNGLNTNRTGYVRGMHSILTKYSKEGKKETEKEEPPNLDEYTGYYHMLPWQPEVYLASWHNKLVLLSLPSENPAESMIELKYMKKDVFRRVRADGELGETYEFLRDEQGSIQKFKRHNNYFTRINK
jgi:CubicO group peptidase (beta-lactamase class C family)